MSVMKNIVPNTQNNRDIFDASVVLPHTIYHCTPATGFLNGFHAMRAKPSDRNDKDGWLQLLVGLIVFPHVNLQLSTTPSFQNFVGRKFYDFCTASPIDSALVLDQFGPKSQPHSRLMEFVVLKAGYHALEWPKASFASLTLFPVAHKQVLMDFVEARFASKPKKLSYGSPCDFWSTVIEAIAASPISGTPGEKKRAKEASTDEQNRLASIRDYLFEVKIPVVTRNTEKILGFWDRWVPFYMGTYLGPMNSDSDFLKDLSQNSQAHQAPRAVARPAPERQRNVKTELQKSIEKTYELYAEKVRGSQQGHDALKYWLDLLPCEGSRLLGLPVNQGNLGLAKDTLRQILEELTGTDDSRSRDDVDLAKQYVVARLDEIAAFEQDPTKKINFSDLEAVTRAFMAVVCFRQISKSGRLLDHHGRLLRWMAGRKKTPPSVVLKKPFFNDAMQRSIDKLIAKFTPIMTDYPMAVTDEHHNVQDIFVDILKKFVEEESKPAQSRFQELTDEEAAQFLAQAGGRANSTGPNSGNSAEPDTGGLAALAGAAEEDREGAESMICILVAQYFRYHHTDGDAQCTARELELFLSLCVNIEIRTIFVSHWFPELFLLSVNSLPLLDREEHVRELKKAVSLTVMDITEKNCITFDRTKMVADLIKKVDATLRSEKTKKRKR